MKVFKYNLKLPDLKMTGIANWAYKNSALRFKTSKKLSINWKHKEIWVFLSNIKNPQRLKAEMTLWRWN